MRRIVAKRTLLAGVMMLLAVAMFLPVSDADAQIRAKRPLSAIERDKLTRLVRDANAGYDVARYKLGTVYLEGKIVRQSYPDAVKWFAAAAQEGHVHSMVMLAMLYSRGQGVERDPAVAYGLVKKLADRGFRMAQYNLGMMLETGQGVARDVKAAGRWYELAQREGSPSAIHRLMEMDVAEMMEVMSAPALRARLVKQAEGGSAVSQYRLGYAYLNGTGVEKDEAAAKKWLTKAANQGFADAEYLVAYLFPVSGSANADYAVPLEWTRKAAMQGHPMAAFNLGGMYEAGQGVDKDWVEAGRWYVYAAGLGNANAIKRLDKLADTCRRFPERPECDEAKLRDAASRADVISLYRIGLAYKDGDGIERNYRQSLFWLRYAAGMGHAKAQYELGDTFENALGVGRSAAQARFWYAKAAAQGHAESAIRLKKLKSDEKGK